MTGVYFNEFDDFRCQWLRNQMDRGLIAEGKIDGRSIADVRTADVAGARHCYFFAGLGAWAHALDLAGWRDDVDVWTGSCPCTPFAVAGKRRGFADARDLWPIWRPLIAERRPPILFGEQVASPLGRDWLARMRSDLDNLGYAVGTACLPAASVGAPHKRERFFFGAVADPDSRRWLGRARDALLDHRQDGGRPQDQRLARRRGAARRDAWNGARWLDGPDGKRRRIGSGVQLLAAWSPNHYRRLRAYGDSLVPQVGAAFVEAFIEAANDLMEGATA
jgi:DNA (cytosine-5)-methyltransferase 1